MTRNTIHAAVAVLLVATSVKALSAQTPAASDVAVMDRIVDEGMNRSQVMEHVIWLADVYGPRLTGSPATEQAADWTMDRLREWGLAEVRQERFAFGRGWSLDRFSAHMIEPQVQPIIGLPKSWTHGTGGPVIADVVHAPILSGADFERYRGTLGGKIVLTQPARQVNLLDGRIVLRMNEDEIREARSEDPRATPSPAPPARTGEPRPAPPSQQAIQAFYMEEGVLALLDRGSDSDIVPGGSDLSWTSQRTDGGTIFVGSGGSRAADAPVTPPSITLAVEHYNRMVRVLERGVPVRMELDVRTRFHDEVEPNAFSIFAEIPGSDPALRDEVVILGAHFDSHHGATGATDNATGSAAMMEAMRILLASEARPRRTIRLALWGAEEQGLIGSRHYVENHLVGQPAFEQVSAYYNIDNGTGRIRGIWLERNHGAGPVFEEWMRLDALRDLGVDIVGPRAVGSTDHASFARVGLPGFQFIQERLEYRSRTHHSNMDVVDRVQPEDMRQMATVTALFAYLTAQRDERLPRPD
ncbi:MAG TPA: M20/M25/M40 family metallo-hydrolase [Longimicrobiales bacterium]|nr:M20/M25/M40 family metallo-hydrolase [Longimicrobiales bacterium]